jgi:hypothetical protein
MDVPPRTPQEFLSLSEWDDDRLRDTVQRIVARDHAEEQAIGVGKCSGVCPKRTRDDPSVTPLASIVAGCWLLVVSENTPGERC